MTLYKGISMWSKAYRDYPEDKPLVKEQVQPSKGIIGCEMHDLNGWGLSYHQEKIKRKRHFFSRLLAFFTKRSKGE